MGLRVHTFTMYTRQGSLLVEQRVAQEVAVAVIKMKAKVPFFKSFFQLLIIVNSLVISAVGNTATLPPDTVDALYHGYEGGGMDINGPFVLVRKSAGTNFSLNGHYYVDSVSSASIDVRATASAYEEERTEYSAGVDFLHEKTIVSAGYTNSEENDFSADTVFVSVSQDFFGDLTNLSLGYSRGWDEVGMIQSDFSEDVDRQNYKLGLSQVITKNMLFGVDVDIITDEGYLNNPYRVYRYQSGSSFETATEKYPQTRTSTAVALRSLYYLPYRASIKAEYRYFTDSWGIEADTFELQYIHPVGPSWVFEGRYRYYQQTSADFYSDLFPFQDSQDFMGRDKELSTFSDYTIGLGASYIFGKGAIPHVDRLKLTALVDYLEFSYDNFRDVTKPSTVAGNEPLYGFDAWVTRISVTMEY
jgi:hypothetical protein